jgi:PAS domain S-box-containing protein
MIFEDSERPTMQPPTSRPTATVDDVLITHQLASRERRAPDYEAECRALADLATAMADSPASVFQKLADAALELCRAGSAGISLREQGEADVFRWEAVAGEYKQYLGNTLPRDFSPCGTVLDRNSCLLMADPIRYFPDIGQLAAPVREVLLVPFYQDDQPVGTVWVVAHDGDTHFDAEDSRIVTSLTKFAGAAVQAHSRAALAEQAHQAESRREEHFRALAAATSDVVYRMSTDWSEMQPLDGRGLIAGNDLPIRDWLQKNIPESEHASVQAAVQEARTSKTMFELEHQVIRADGTLGWTFSRAIPLFDNEGQIVEWFGAASDITRRKTAEENLRDIRARMEAALTAGTIGTWSWDVQQDRFFGDASLARLFGVEQEDVAGGPLVKLMHSIHPEDRPRVARDIERAIQDRSSYEADYRLLQEDGGWRWITARGNVETDATGQVVRFPGVVIDITERKQVEAELLRVTEEAERRKRLYEAILASTPDFVYVFSLDYRVIYANESLATMWGQAGSASFGKTFLELGYPDWHAEMHMREIDQVRATKQPLRGEVPFHGTHGRRIYEYIFVPVLGADGEVEAVAGTTRDVTSRKDMEDELRQADRKKDDFIALLAHELRNPLAPIRNGLHVLHLAEGDASAVAAARNMMDRQLGHMVRLIDDLLDISRISRNKMQLRRENILLADVIDNAIEAIKPLLDTANHTLRVELPPQPVRLDADLTRLAQVFGNLLSNSVKYTPAGGLISLAAECEGAEVVVSVRDNGIGIPADFLPHIFDMFSQVDRSFERSSGGLGIGLALVKGLVEMHGGTVAAFSEGAARGSQFTVRLPTIQPQRPAVEAPVAIAERVKRRLLVVDDNHDGATSLAMMLRLLGNEVRTAHDGIAAIEVAAEFLPEVILMDVGMPRLNGLDAARHIKSEPWGEVITIIALTGWGQEDDRQRSAEAGCSGHLVKPVDFTQLQQTLSSLSNR